MTDYTELKIVFTDAGKFEMVSSIFITTDFGALLSFQIGTPTTGMLTPVSKCCGLRFLPYFTPDLERYSQCRSCHKRSAIVNDDWSLDPAYSDHSDEIIEAYFDSLALENNLDLLEIIPIRAQFLEDVASLRSANRYVWSEYSKLHTAAISGKIDPALAHPAIPLKKWLANPRTRKSERFTSVDMKLAELFPNRVAPPMIGAS